MLICKQVFTLPLLTHTHTQSRGTMLRDNQEVKGTRGGRPPPLPPVFKASVQFEEFEPSHWKTEERTMEPHDDFNVRGSAPTQAVRKLMRIRSATSESSSSFHAKVGERPSNAARQPRGLVPLDSDTVRPARGKRRGRNIGVL